MRKLFPLGLLLFSMIAAACDYTIVESEAPPLDNSTVAVVITPGSATIAPGDSARFRAIVTGSPDTTVTWSVVSGTGNIYSDGVFVASSAAGVTTIRARSNADTAKSATATVIIDTAGDGHGVIVTVTPQGAKILPASSQQFSASVAGAANTGVVWRIVGPGSISSTGLYSAPSKITENPTIVIVEAQSIAYASAIGRATLEVMVPDDPSRICFERDIKPVFVSNCAMTDCHDPATREDGYDLTTTAGILRGVKPGNINDSEIYKSISKAEEERMPLNKPPLPAGTIELIRRWILSGASTEECPPPYGACDTVNVTYTSTVRPVLTTNCLGCHTGASSYNKNVDLSTHAGVHDVALDGRLAGSIMHAPSYSPMPQGGSKLDNCTIAKINAWITRGAPND